ncbi:hypothetical protein APR64_09090 [Enterobacter hormaechei]|uniref:endonuclease domain-containing protein n=1 Tax=Enterobacter cloacae complex TaxID=354276 RepID=UPI0005F10B6C|nr:MULTISPECIES: endonuclease domain-containing protein [Enterobacter cloacae complex]MCM7590137.1 endonuclease domain-containing protein [Enterobacter chuandaensis]GHM25460.1 hypothetical protein EBZU44_40040 [Enterobacter cloacae]HAS0710177.1 endonuclease VII [Enterobacter hormaechei subsp. steigerwaltii]KJL72600.1 hypothetical protein SS38_05845 [Enterobacter hormaechei subsp. xiangfangensis]KUH53011.1 hypothetical protein APR64_09090 [Enterobacter hormaechei]
MKRKDIPKYKQELFKKQKGVCPLSQLKIEDVNKAHLDHDHILEGPNAGRCRGLLIAQANVLEGRIKHQFKRSGLDGKVDYLTFLKNLVLYLEKDYSMNPTHPQLITDLKKQFKRKSLTEMKQTLRGYNTEKKQKKELEILYNKHIKATYETDEIRKVSTGNEKAR